MIRKRFWIVILLIFSLAWTLPASTQDSPSQRIIGYFSSWSIYGRAFYVTDIAAGMLTHINYAFANISPAGECVLGDEWADTQYPYPGEKEGDGLLGNFHQLQVLKQTHPHLQTLISVGGWTWSGRFSDLALTEESRRQFARSCVDFMLKYGFDGIDLDWEYPAGGGHPDNVERPEDPANFILLLAEVRRQLDKQGAQDGRHYLLTIAAPAGENQINPIQWKQVQQHLDWINVMAYDFAGSWSTLTDFNAPLYDRQSAPEGTGRSVDSAIRRYLEAGAEPGKLVLGVPFYGRGWKEVGAENNGLYQPFGAVPSGTWGEGVFEFQDIEKFWSTVMQRYWDDTAKVPWLYFDKTGLMISYDDPESLQMKTDYIQEHELGGVMFWELSADSHQHTLLKALWNGLN